MKSFCSTGQKAATVMRLSATQSKMAARVLFIDRDSNAHRAGLLGGDLGRLDQVPKCWILLQRFVLLHFDPGAKQEILERMTIQNAVDDQPKFVPLKINPVIPDPKAMERSARSLQFSEVVHLGVHGLVGQTAKFSQDVQLQFL